MADSKIWDNYITIPDTPAGFSLRTTYPNNPDGVEVMLERWVAGSSEPPHSHPGDDMTVIIEGKMQVQFYQQTDSGLKTEGEPVILNMGETAYISAGRIHGAHYVDDCKLIYVHDRAFGFNAH